MTVRVLRIECRLALAALCLVLAIPSQLHSALVEVGAHDVEGAVAVDARHAHQGAHVEHSAVEMHGHCMACAPPGSKKALAGTFVAPRHLLQPAGHPTVSEASALSPRFDPGSRGRAPPLR